MNEMEELMSMCEAVPLPEPQRLAKARARVASAIAGTRSSVVTRGRPRPGQTGQLGGRGRIPPLSHRWRAWLAPFAAAVAVAGVIIGTETVLSGTHSNVAPPGNNPPGATAPGHGPGTGPGPVIAYALTGDTVTPIQTTTNTTLPPFKLASSVTAAAFSPDGKTAYFFSPSALTGQVGTVTPVRTATDTPLKPIPVGNANNMVMTPNGKTLYITNLVADTVTPVRTATGTALPPIKVSGNPDALAVTPDGSTVYTAGFKTGWVTPIRTATNTALPPIKVGGHLVDIAITPDGKTAYVAAGDRVTPIDTATNTALKPIIVPQNIRNMLLSPNGAALYIFATGSLHHPKPTVTPIRTATNTALHPIPAGSPLSDSWEMVISPDGSILYVLDSFDNAVIRIRTATSTTLPPLKPGKGPSALVITPDGKTLYVADNDRSLHAGVVTPIRTATGAALAPIKVDAAELVMSP